MQKKHLHSTLVRFYGTRRAACGVAGDLHSTLVRFYVI